MDGRIKRLKKDNLIGKETPFKKFQMSILNNKYVN